MQVYKPVNNQLNSHQKYTKEFLQYHDAIVGQVLVDTVRDQKYPEVDGRITISASAI
jgi:hypothetical protein